jgi:hypothetical protein
MRVCPRRGVAFVLGTLLTVRASTAFAQAKPAAPVQAEARMRFDLGIKLFNDGDNAGALAEFERANRLLPNPVVLYNIGLVYAAMGRSVDAVTTLDQVLASPGAVTGEKLVRARATRDQQAQRIAELWITTSVPAAVDVDGVVVGQAPLPGPIKVTSGVHQVGAVATGYVPARKEVTVAGGTREDVTLSPAPMQILMAHSIVRTHLPGASVFVDGQPRGTTPLAESLTLQPGTHTIELRREGYRTTEKEVSLGEGASAEVTLEPDEDTAAVVAMGGALALKANEPNVNVTVDGVAKGLYAEGLRVAPGGHQVIVERGGFEPVTADVVVRAHATSTLHVVLDPTAETRADYEHKRRTRHEAGLIVAGSGALVTAGAIAFIVWDTAQTNSLQGPYNAAYAAFKNMSPPNCNISAGGAANVCNQAVSNAYNALHDRESLAPIGYVGLGAGVAALVTGAVVYFTAGRSDRFPSHTPPTTSSIELLPWVGVAGGGAGLRVVLRR